MISQGGTPVAAQIGKLWVGLEMVGRETTVLKNWPKLFCKIVPCKPLSGSDEYIRNITTYVNL